METEIYRLTRRCPRLGGPVSFEYCRTCEPECRPCWKVFDCWWQSFDVVSHMRQCLSAEQFDRLVESRPKPKVESLLALITQAKENSERSDR